MINKVLVANRGEIAVRIIRALREMKITSVAVFSEADRTALHTELADEAICIGPARGLDSYANPLAVLNAALVTGADAIHPGYGFLSERADFADLCEDAGIAFVGPNGDLIRQLGSKQTARETMRAAGVPVIPGSAGLVMDLEAARTVASEIGYPLMIKASDGGGGKGMRRVDEASQLETLFSQAQQETLSNYGNKDLYIEKIIQPARHIEVQLLGDQHGQVIHLGERDCSLQRKNQKVIEIAPAIGLAPTTREAICQTAVKACQAINYVGAGTIEFLVDPEGNFYFMEMNTRLQVEHPISEEITGIDIVQEQIQIAKGQPLSVSQDQIEFSGASIECRLNAEDPALNFQPSCGHIGRLILPSGGLGLRVETAIYPDYDLPPYYDSMVAKIITHQGDHDAAFDQMERALYEVHVEGIRTNIELLEALCQSPAVRAGQVDTLWLERVFLPRWLDLLDQSQPEEDLDQGEV